MADDDLRGRVARQFSSRDGRADVWWALDLLLATDRYLNLGYSPRGCPTLLGDSQRRLVDHVGDRLAGALGETAGGRLLDLGCGRGGPAVRLADRHGVRVVGVDLVADNVARARANARGTDAAFVVGDATALPVRTDSMGAATAIDTLVYLPELGAAVEELARVLEPGAPFVCSDLVLRADPARADRRAAAAFAEAWDMPALRTTAELVAALEGTGFAVRGVEDLTPHSVGRFRRYTTPVLWLVDGPVGGRLAGLIGRAGLDPALVAEQVRTAHRALPALRHVLVAAALHQPRAGEDDR